MEEHPVILGDVANELSIGVKLAYGNWDDNYNNMNWFKPVSPPQLLPKDLLQNSRMISGDEVDKQINKVLGGVTSTSPSLFKPSDTFTPVNMMNGDSISLTRPGVSDLILSAGGNVTVTNVEQQFNALSQMVQTTVTYEHPLKR